VTLDDVGKKKEDNQNGEKITVETKGGKFLSSWLGGVEGGSEIKTLQGKKREREALSEARGKPKTGSLAAMSSLGMKLGTG